jgi:hypothetical protein
MEVVSLAKKQSPNDASIGKFEILATYSDRKSASTLGEERSMSTNVRIIPNETRDSAMLFKSLGDPARLNLLALLATEGEMFVGQMCERTGYTQPAISSQLRILRVNNPGSVPGHLSLAD